MKASLTLVRTLAVLLIAAASACRSVPAPDLRPAALPALIPWPADFDRIGGAFALLPETTVVYEAGLERRFGIAFYAEPGADRSGR